MYVETGKGAVLERFLGNCRETPSPPYHVASAPSRSPWQTARGGGHGYPTASVDDGVQAAVDAQELVSSLRSEVSALERHAAALEASLVRLEDASVATVDLDLDLDLSRTPKKAKRVTRTGIDADAGSAEQDGGHKAPSNEDRVDERLEVDGAAAERTGSAQGGRAGRKKLRLERRKRAAAVLRQAIGEGGAGGAEPTGLVTEMPAATEMHMTQGDEAKAVELAREERRRAQETFVSRSGTRGRPVLN